MQPNQIVGLCPRRISVLFALADAFFLMVVGMASNSAMHLIHALEWNLALTLALGMAAAMAVQMLLALLAAPVLGSIESMVPSMIVGMVSPMQLCVVALFGHHPAPSAALLTGAALGLITFITVRFWGRWHGRSLGRTFSET